MNLINRKFQDHICTLTINRPEQLNALNSQLLSDLDDHLTWIENNNKCRVVILTGIGDKSFIAGADIEEMLSLDASKAKMFCSKGQSIASRIENLRIPVIAAINGYALGGGCEYALSCHMRFCSDNAVFGQPEVGLGLIAGWGGTQRLPRLIGKGLAFELLLSGKSIIAEEALSIGLINKIFSKEDLINETEKFAQIIIKKSPIAIEKTIKSVNAGFDLPLIDGLVLENELFSDLFNYQDTKEGLLSFLEKRKPNFKGK